MVGDKAETSLVCKLRCGSTPTLRERGCACVAGAWDTWARDWPSQPRCSIGMLRWGTLNGAAAVQIAGGQWVKRALSATQLQAPSPVALLMQGAHTRQRRRLVEGGNQRRAGHVAQVPQRLLPQHGAAVAAGVPQLRQPCRPTGRLKNLMALGMPTAVGQCKHSLVVYGQGSGWGARRWLGSAGQLLTQLQGHRCAASMCSNGRAGRVWS